MRFRAFGGPPILPRHGAARGQTLVLGALLLALLVLPLALVVFEEQMTHGTAAALQQAARGAALDGLSALDQASLGTATPRLDEGEVRQIVEQSLRVSLRQTAPEVSVPAAQAAAHAAAVTGTQVTGLTVCVSVAVPVHLLINGAWTRTYAARACAQAVVPGPAGGL